MAALAVCAISCEPDREPVFSPENSVAPVLDPLTIYEMSDSTEVFAELTFTPADFGMSVAKSYTAYVDLSGNNFESQIAVGTIIGSPDVEKETLTVTSDDVNQALLDLGCAEGEEVGIELRIMAQLMGESTVVSGTEIYSNSVSATVTPYSMEKVYSFVYLTGAPWGWDPALNSRLLNYAEDDENYVGVVDFGADCADYSFKITGDASWDNGNWGSGSATSSEPEAPSIQLWNDGGSGNITNYTSYRYYNFHFVKSTAVLNMNKGFNSVKVAGDFNGWATDDTNTAEMTHNPVTGKFYIDLDIPSDGGFKFILDGGGVWIGTGSGEGLVGIGTGDNISVSAGQYRFYLDLNDWDNPTYELSDSDYGMPVE